MARRFDQPYLILVLCSLFWGGNVVAGKAAVGEITPTMLMVLRWCGAVLALLPFALGPLRRDWPRIARHWPLYLFYGVVGFAGFNLLVYVGAHFTSGVNTALIQVSINIMVMAFNFALFGTRVKLLQLAGVGFTILGVVLTVTRGDLGRLAALNLNFGDVLVLGACLAYAAYSVGLRWRPPSHWLSFLMLTFSAAALFSLLSQFTQSTAGATDVTTKGWLIVAYTIAFPTLVSQLFYVMGVEMIGANRASLFINLIPLFGALGSVAMLGERLEEFHFWAGALIVIGIGLAEWSARRVRRDGQQD